MMAQVMGVGAAPLQNAVAQNPWTVADVFRNATQQVLVGVAYGNGDTQMGYATMEGW